MNVHFIGERNCSVILIVLFFAIYLEHTSGLNDDLLFVVVV